MGNVYVSMIDDAKFAQPDAQKIKNLSYFRHPPDDPAARDVLMSKRAAEEKLDEIQEVLPSQSGLVEQNGVDEPLAATQLETIAGEAEMTDQTMNVFFGENVTSIRELVKRYVMTRYWINFFPYRSGATIISLSNKVFPYQRGYDSQGLDAKSAGSYTVSNMNPINYFQACYAGYRGAIRHKYLSHTAGGMVNPIVERENYSPDTAGIWSFVPLGAGQMNSAILTNKSTKTTWQGAAGTGLMINNGIEVEFPFYNRSRFGHSRLIEAQDLDCHSTTMHLTASLDAAPLVTVGTADPTEKVSFQQWTAAGEDFSFYFFTGVPIMYQYTD